MAQITKGYNITINIGYTSTDKQTADIATKYHPGLITSINSLKWRHGDEDKLVPLLNEKTTYITACKGELSWVALDAKCSYNNCREFCRLASDLKVEKFCNCETCNTAFWKPYEYL